MGYKIYLNITCRNKMCYVFVNTKITQYKTSPTLQIDVFVIPNKKILENCCQNLNCFSWIKLIPVLIHVK